MTEMSGVSNASNPFNQTDWQKDLHQKRVAEVEEKREIYHALLNKAETAKSTFKNHQIKYNSLKKQSETNKFVSIFDAQHNMETSQKLSSDYELNADVALSSLQNSTDSLFYT
ncbi:hypothetical protein KBA27_01360 [bacterium]|nr:hypothetical protein [bacterium]